VIGFGDLDPRARGKSVKGTCRGDEVSIKTCPTVSAWLAKRDNRSISSRSTPILILRIMEACLGNSKSYVLHARLHPFHQHTTKRDEIRAKWRRPIRGEEEALLRKDRLLTKIQRRFTKYFIMLKLGCRRHSHLPQEIQLTGRHEF
jgi:hypothetical protein